MPHPTRDALDLIIGQNLRFFRLRRGFSLTRLGAALRVSHQQIQKFECATNRLSAVQLYILSRMLRVPFAEFFRRRRWMVDLSYGQSNSSLKCCSKRSRVSGAI